MGKAEPITVSSLSQGMNCRIASLPTGYYPVAYGSAVLADGRVVLEGGEYDGSGNFVLSNQGAIYNPKTNTWTALSPPAGCAVL